MLCSSNKVLALVKHSETIISLIVELASCVLLFRELINHLEMSKSFFFFARILVTVSNLNTQSPRTCPSHFYPFKMQK